MMLTFRVKLIETLKGTKVTTIRIETPARYRYWDIHSDLTNTERHEPIIIAVGYQQKYFDRLILKDGENTGKLWWKNPRNQSPFCRKIGEVSLKHIERKLGYFLTTEDAKKDGFKTHGELIVALGRTNKMLEHEVHTAMWYIYSWENKPVTFEDNMEFISSDEHWKYCMEMGCPICQELGWLSGAVRNKEV